MIEAPPGKGKGSNGHHSVEALEALQSSSRHHPRSAREEISSAQQPVNTAGGVRAEILGGLLEHGGLADV
jgi:hypothetical protein